MYILEGFKLYKAGISNWFSVALNQFILQRDVVCKIKNVGEIKLKSNYNYLNSSLFKNIIGNAAKSTLTENQKNILKTYLNQIENDEIVITNLEDGKQFRFLNEEMGMVLETFLYDDYKNIPYCDNKIIIDIGANVGDTPIYFANKGYDVYAFEPLPHIAKIARKNLNLNPNIKNKITYINKAVSGKKKTILINFDKNGAAGASEFSVKDNKIEVEAVTIEEIIAQYNIIPDILKMDCEGCEVSIIKNSDLSIFSEIIFEYHTNATGVEKEVLIDLLEKQGFKLKNIDEKKDKLGIVHMIKR